MPFRPPTSSLHRLLTAVSLIAAIASAHGAGAPEAAQPPGELDRILVIVNDEAITATQLAARMREARAQIAAERITAPPPDVLEKQVIERMILEQAQLQYAERAGIRVSDADLERGLANLARQNKLTVDQLLARAEQEGLGATALRQQLRQQMLIDQLVDREVRNRVSVSEGEVDRMLADLESRAAVNAEYHLSHIFLPVPESASPEALQSVKQQAAELLAKLRQGADFSQLALAHSRNEEAMKGGNLGWRKAGQLPELFLSAVRGLRPGEVSEVLRSPNGFHILKLHEARGNVRSEPVTQTHARHILLRTGETLSLNEAKARLESLRARIEQGDDFAALARAHSEDPGSAAKGGDLGWVTPGALVPEFERAMNALKPGALSEPVQSAFGVHLIQVLERREQDVSEERLRNQARAQLHARKAEERYQQWLRQLRDESYVEYLAIEE